MQYATEHRQDRTPDGLLSAEMRVAQVLRRCPGLPDDLLMRSTARSSKIDCAIVSTTSAACSTGVGCAGWRSHRLIGRVTLGAGPCYAFKAAVDGWPTVMEVLGVSEPLVRRLAPSISSFDRVAAWLGWSGAMLPETTVFGCCLLPMVTLDVETHRTRLRDGDGPQLDADVLAMWEWHGWPGPRPVARLSGALFQDPVVARALAQARQWRPFGSAAVLVPADAIVTEVLRWECALYGIGLVPEIVADAACVPIPAEYGRRAPARRRTVDRWIEETLYALAIDSRSVD